MNTANLNLEAVNANQAPDLVSVFERSFAASEGEQEGQLIAALVGDILQTTASDDLLVFQARMAQRTIAAICFTRLRFDARCQAFLLSPVAVLPESQRQGVGQALIRAGVDALRQKGADWVFTYGDPAYYGKLGFEPADTALAPYALSQPIGWQAVALKPDASPTHGKARCVSAFANPDLW